METEKYEQYDNLSESNIKKQESEKSRLGTAPVSRLMLSMGIPMILSMMLQAFYNIVDSAFIANMPEVGENAQTALTLAFPMQMLMIAISIGTGVGTNALLSKSLGFGDKEKVNKAAGNAIFLGCIIFIVFVLFGIFGVEPYIRSQSENEMVIEMAIDYLRICTIISFGVVFYAIYEKLLQATGRSLYSTIAQCAGAVVNIVLDPIMIYGLLGCPELGVSGAAYATVIGQMVSTLTACIFHIKFNKEISNSLKYIKPSLKIIGQIYSIGFPAIISQALMSVMTYGLNLILGNIGQSFVTAYGLYYKIQQFVLFAAFGLRDAITPIVSFNHGMKNRSRINDGIKYGVVYTLLIMCAGLILIEIFASPLVKIFGLSSTTENLCVAASRIISISFIFAGLNIAFQGIFQALDSGMESLIVSLCRQLIFVLPVAWVLSLIVLGDSNLSWLVWWTFPIAEFVSAVIAFFLIRRSYKNKVAVLKATAV